MAEAYGKLTGTPGLVFVTRGPGATNAAIGIHTAAQDSTPMILFIGQVGSDMVDREAFQEIDYRQMFGSVAKWAAQIDRAERIPEYVAHAFRSRDVRPAGAGRARVARRHADRARRVRGCAARGGGDRRAGAGAIAAAHALLAGARRRSCIVGGSRWDAQRATRCMRFAEAHGLPVACAFRRQDLFDNRHPQYAGDVGIGINPKLAARVRDADLLLVIGERLGEMTTSGYTLLDVPAPRQRLVHVHPGAEELGRVYQPELAIAATPGAFLAALNALPPLARTDVARAAQRRERRLRGVARAASGTRRRRHVAHRAAGSTSACPTTRSSPTARATTRRGCIASTATAASARSSRPTPARWATACPRPSPPRSCTASAWSCPGTATAAS